MLVVVATPPVIGMAPLLIRIIPVPSFATLITPFRQSQTMVNKPVAGLKDAEPGTAGNTRFTRKNPRASPSMELVNESSEPVPVMLELVWPGWVVGRVVAAPDILDPAGCA